MYKHGHFIVSIRLCLFIPFMLGEVHSTDEMSIRNIPVYILIPHTEEDEKEIFGAFAEAGPITKKVPNTDTLEGAFDAILNANRLDEDYWLQEFRIIVDRPEWKSKDGVLVVNRNFKGNIDGELTISNRYISSI